MAKALHFDRVCLLRAHAAFHVHRARTANGSARLLVTGAPRRDLTRVRACLGRLADAHRRLHVEGVAPLAEVELDGPEPFVALACDPLADGQTVIARLGQHGHRVSYCEAIAVVDRIGRTLECAHATADEANRRFALGGLAWANVIVDADGSLSLLGFGHQIVGRDEHDVPAGAPSFFSPPELARGGDPTPSSDAFGFVMLQRSVVGHAELPEPLARALAGEQDGTELERDLRALVDASTHGVIAAAPREREGMPTLRERWRREWDLLSVRPDPASLGHRLRQLLASPDLVVASDGSWIRVNGQPEVRLSGRGPLRRILLRLVEAHLTGASGVSLEQVVETGWPADRSRREAVLNRAYVVVSELRRLGPPEWIERDDRGYHIRRTVTVARTGGGAGEHQEP